MAGYLEDSDGHKSSNRLMFVVGSIYAMAMGAWVFGWTHDWVAATGTVTSIATIFGAQKLIQKNMENAPTA